MGTAFWLYCSQGASYPLTPILWQVSVGFQRSSQTRTHRPVWAILTSRVVAESKAREPPMPFTNFTWGILPLLAVPFEGMTKLPGIYAKGEMRNARRQGGTYPSELCICFSIDTTVTLKACQIKVKPRLSLFSPARERAPGHSPTDCMRQSRF